MVNEAVALSAETRSSSTWRDGGEEVSAIAWFGYGPPGTADVSVLEAGCERRANEAAPDLADFYRGINATNDTVPTSLVGLRPFLRLDGDRAGAQRTRPDRCRRRCRVLRFARLWDIDERDVAGYPLEWRYLIADEPDLYMGDSHVYVMSAPATGCPATRKSSAVRSLGRSEPTRPEPADAPARTAFVGRGGDPRRPGSTGWRRGPRRLPALDGNGSCGPPGITWRSSRPDCRRSRGRRRSRKLVR